MKTFSPLVPLSVQTVTSVTAMTDATTLSAEITDAAGHISHLSLTLDNPPTGNQPAGAHFYSCNAYFDRDDNLIALGVSYGFPERYSLRIGVADVQHAKWIGEWTVGPTAGMYQPLLVGFLEGTTSVVVGGEPSTPTQYGAGIRHGSFWSLLFSPQGELLEPAPTKREYASESDLFPRYPDAKHNRLWVFRCTVVSAPWSRQPDCPVQWMTLIGLPSSSPEFTPGKAGEKRTDFWMSPGTFEAPDSNTIIVAEGSTVWIVDMEKQTLSRITIPKRFHFPKFEEIHGAAAISSDGGIVAVPLVKEAIAFPYLADNYVYKGTDFAVLQVRPFHILGILPGAGPKSWASCAIENRDGHVVALIFRQNHWERTDLNRSPSRR